jgi:hypothetical protein
LVFMSARTVMVYFAVEQVGGAIEESSDPV